MHALTEEILEHTRAAWRYRTVGAVAAWIAAIVGWSAVLVWPNSYEASARVFVNTSTALRPLLQGLAVDQDVDSQINLVRESLLGKPRLERVVREADLDLNAKSASDKERLVAGLQTDIIIDSQAPRSGRQGVTSSDSVYTITYHNRNREKALTVVRSLLNSLVEDTMSGKRAGADTAQHFLEDQIATYEKRLSAAENELAEFKKHNVGLVPGEQGDYFSRLQSEIMAERKVKSSLEIALRRRGELQRQLSGETPVAAATAPPGAGSARTGTNGTTGGNDTASRIAETQAKLDDMLLRFTDKHPDVLALQETLAQLKARQKEELAAIRRGDPSAVAASGLATNPVYQSIQLQINQADVEIAALRGELADHERAEAELRKTANSAPEVEAEFARLTRDYNVEKAQYTALVERLQKAKLSEDAATTGIVQFQVINPPAADLKPKSPNRPPLIVAVLVASMALGIALAWGLSQLKPVFSSSRRLEEATGLPVLGLVSRTWEADHEAAARKSNLRLGAAMGGLAAVCVLVLVVNFALIRTT